MKWTRQRRHVALRTLATADFSPSCASEITSLTPRRPRRASLRRKSVQNVSASEQPTAKPRIFAPSIVIDADGDGDGKRNNTAALTGFDIGCVTPKIGPLASKGRFRKVFTLSSISSHKRLTWLLEIRLIPMACTRSSTER